MWWKWIIRAVLALSEHPAVRAWAQRAAARAIERVREKAAVNVEELKKVADPPPPPESSTGWSA